MIRLNFELKELSPDNFIKFLSSFTLSRQIDVTQHLAHNNIGYKYLYTIKIDNGSDKCSFAIGMDLHSNAENINKGFIEFNPNKCCVFLEFEEFYEHFCSFLSSATLVRYDVALDVPCKRDNVKMVKSGRCNYERLVTSRDGLVLNSSITEYQGCRNKNKFTKLYDKTIESNLDYDLTRIEFTFDKEETSFLRFAKI